MEKWEPLPYQNELTRSSSKTRVVIGGNRTGKTEWGAREVYYFLTGTHPNRSIVPPIEVWVATPSFDTQLEGAQPKLLKFLKEKDIAKVEYLRGELIQRIHLKNGSTITFKSYEQGKEKFQGAAKRLIWFDEEPPHDIWTEAVVRHEAGVPLDIILTMTPINGMTWVYDEVYQGAEAKGIALRTPAWKDNTHLTQDQIDQIKMLLDPSELQVREFGRFVRKVGLVCNWWRRDVHVLDMSSFQPKGKTIWIGIDFGFTSAYTAAIFVALHGDDIYIFDGIYEKGLTTDLLAQRLKQKLAGLFITGWRGDSAQAEDLAELKRYGIPIQGVKKETGAVTDNWDEFRAKKLTEVGKVNLATNKPRLYISSNLIHEVEGRVVNWFAAEIEGLRWKTVRSADGEKIKQEWGDQQKDAIDALTYILVELPTKIPEGAKFVNVNERIQQIPTNDLPEYIND